MRGRPDLAVIVVVLAVAGVFGALTWINLLAGTALPGGSGLLPYWGAARVMWFQNASPYGAGAASYIQRVAVLQGLRGVEPFNGPLLLLVLFFPLAAFQNFNTALAVWWSVLELGVAGISLLTLILFELKLPTWRLVLMFILGLGWVYGMTPVLNGDLAILTSLAVLGAIPALFAGRDRMAGILIAIALLKPFSAPLLLAYVILWVLGNHRRAVFVNMILFYGIFTAISFFLRAEWLLEWQQMWVGRGEFHLPPNGFSALQELSPSINPLLLLGIAVLVWVLILISWWSAARRSTQAFLWTAMLTLAVTPFTGIPYNDGGLTLLIVPLALVFLIWERRWERNGYLFSTLAQTALLVGLWFLSSGLTGDLSASLRLLASLLLSVLLIWGRWWALEPVQMPYERMRRKLGGL